MAQGHKTRWTPDRVRERIRTGMMINRLQQHVAGRLEMSRTQVQAAGILLRKTLPDMVAQTLERRPLESLDDAELLTAIRALTSAITASGAEPRVEPPPEREAPRVLPSVQ